MKKQQQLELLRHFKTKDGTPFQIPAEGSLGLLAYGDIGLIAWRMKKQTVLKQQ